MYSQVQLALKYIRYWLAASSGKGHGIHSPFVFHFITKILSDKQHYPAYDKVEALRQSLLKNKSILRIEDFGAGSAVNKSDQRTISSLAKNVARPKKYGQLLFRMTQHYRPQIILELGTSLGITTTYLALANDKAQVITMEGSEEIANTAINNFKLLNISNIQLSRGNFDLTLSSVIYPLSSVGFAFIDGNHRREPTQQYFEQLLPKTGNDSILVFDDIHWSREMEEAWDMIKNHPAVRCTIDLFFMGVVFFRQEFKGRQHFSIRF